MEDYVLGNWESTNLSEKNKKGKSQKGPAGNVVPFFPTEWKLNANDVFNQIMNGQEGTEDDYDETKYFNQTLENLHTASHTH